jgi:hypothetical protein
MSEVRFRRAVSASGWFFSMPARVLSKTKISSRLKFIVFLALYLGPTLYVGAWAGAISRNESRRWHTTPATIISKELVHTPDNPALAMMVYQYQIEGRPLAQSRAALPWDTSVGTQFTVWARADGAMTPQAPPQHNTVPYLFLGLIAGIAMAVLWLYAGTRTLEAIESWPKGRRPRWYSRAYERPQRV